jgi:hypothetical protein
MERVEDEEELVHQGQQSVTLLIRQTHHSPTKTNQKATHFGVVLIGLYVWWKMNRTQSEMDY